jgi:hypothetical protein
MAFGSTRINRYNMHQLPAHERMQYLRERRAMAAEVAQKNASVANTFASIQANKAVEMGNLFSKIAMQRISKIA